MTEIDPHTQTWVVSPSTGEQTQIEAYSADSAANAYSANQFGPGSMAVPLWLSGSGLRGLKSGANLSAVRTYEAVQPVGGWSTKRWGSMRWTSCRFTVRAIGGEND